MKRLFMTALVFTCVCAISAQEHKHPAGSKPATMNIPQPAPEMKKLAKMLVGAWRIDEKVLPSSMSPNGSTGRGSESIRIGPGSTSIVMDYKGSAMGNFNGHGILTWSPEKKAYESVWVDNMMPGGFLTMTGNWQGENLVFSGKDNMQGSPMQSRHTYSDLKPDSFTYTMEVGPDGGKLEKMLVLEYKRAPGTGQRAKASEPSASNKQ